MLETVLSLFKLGHSTKTIASVTHIKERKVKEKTNEYWKGIVNVFSLEEDLIILNKLKEGIHQPKALKAVLPKKSWWMIRNRLQQILAKFPDIETTTETDIRTTFHPNEVDSSTAEGSIFDVELGLDLEHLFDGFESMQNPDFENFDSPF